MFSLKHCFKWQMVFFNREGVFRSSLQDCRSAKRWRELHCTVCISVTLALPFYHDCFGRLAVLMNEETVKGQFYAGLRWTEALHVFKQQDRPVLTGQLDIGALHCKGNTVVDFLDAYL